MHSDSLLRLISYFFVNVCIFLRILLHLQELFNNFFSLLQAFGLGHAGEALTKKLRLESFRNLLRQDIGFYDDLKHGTGKLCTRFATDAPNVRYVRIFVIFSTFLLIYPYYSSSFEQSSN